MLDRLAIIVTYIASFFAFILGILEEHAAAFGVVIGATTMLINLWFKHKEYLILKNKENKDGTNCI